MVTLITKPWWFGELSNKYSPSTDNVKLLNAQMTHLRESMENWKIEWRNITTRINSIYSENLELLAQRDEAWETIEALKRQLNLRGKMIEELRGFIDQENVLSTKWNKKHAEMCQEVLNRKKKAKITGK